MKLTVLGLLALVLISLPGPALAAATSDGSAASRRGPD
jgi:hypothetical protein